MVKKCVYCYVRVDDNCVVDMCERCMYQVWGEKMAKTIIANMERERAAGNLELGQVGSSEVRERENKKDEADELISGVGTEDNELSLPRNVSVEELIDEAAQNNKVEEVVVEEVSAEELAMEGNEGSRFGAAESL